MKFLQMIAVASVAFAGSAWAQSGSSFDCAKASTVVERTICTSPELGKADRDMAAVYAALAGKLSGAAKDHLVKDQVRWIGNRGPACSDGPLETPQCLKARYADRTAFLRALGGRGTYPFVSEHDLVKNGRVRTTRYLIDASYPQFDGGTADFTATNRRFADDAQKGADEAIPPADYTADRGQTWSYDQGFALYRPSADAVAVATRLYSYTGGAHGNGGTFASLVDLRSGRIVPPSAVFKPGNEWLRTVTAMVGADLKRQFVERPGFDDALEPANLTKLMTDPDRWLFRAEGLQILFNPYDVGSYAGGPYTVDIPYDKIRSLFRADGPIGS
jgi:uncharacterized protein YecT (DUF1311 family)